MYLLLPTQDNCYGSEPLGTSAIGCPAAGTAEVVLGYVKSLRRKTLCTLTGSSTARPRKVPLGMRSEDLHLA